MKLSVSTNPEKEENLIAYIKEMDEYNVDFIHCDMMDGKFVKAQALSVGKIKELKNHTTIPLDVHFMGYPTMAIIDHLILVGANILTLHAECVNIAEWIEYSKTIHDHHLLMGLAINPETSIDQVKDYLPYVDLVLIMSVVPGKSGQTFISDTYEKIKTINALREKHPFILEVDGGVTSEIAKELKNLNVASVVMGNALYKSNNRKKIVDEIQKM